MIIRLIQAASSILATISFFVFVDISKAATANSVSDFVQSIGINTHTSEPDYANTDLIKKELTFLGVHSIRDFISRNPNNLAQLKMISSYGAIKILDTIRTTDQGYSGDSEYKDGIIDVNNNADIVLAVEGPNEVDKFPPKFGKFNRYDAVEPLQEAIYNQIRNIQPNTKQLPIFSLTVSNPGNLANFPGYISATDTKPASLPAKLTMASDRLSMHVYFQYDTAPNDPLTNWIGTFVTGLRPLSPKPLAVTEFGWWTNHPVNNVPTIMDGVPEKIQAKYILNFLFDAYQIGSRNNFIYELLDETADLEPCTAASESAFGMFRAAGSTSSVQTLAKPAAKGLHNLTTILADTGAPVSGDTLQYNIPDMPPNGEAVLLERSDETFVIAVWNDQPIWDNNKYVETPVKDVTIHVDFGQTVSSGSIYDPLQGTSPSRKFVNKQGITMSLADHPSLFS